MSALLIASQRSTPHDSSSAILFEDLPYLVLFNPPVLEVYRGDSVEFPFTDVLSGLTSACNGCPGVVKTKS